MKSKQFFSKLAAFTLVLIWATACTPRNPKKSTAANTGPESQPTLMVFAAASLTDVLSEMIDSFEVNHKVKIQTNMASSGTLARQIEQGGEPDIYISASKKWADYVDSLGYLVEGSKQTIAQNELVLVAPLSSPLEVGAIDSTLDFVSLIGSQRLSMGDPAHVPAGKYAQQALEYFGWQEQLEGRTLPAKDVRSALMVVEMEEAPLGIVYRTDAQKSQKVKILHAFPEASHSPIVYTGGICRQSEESTALFNYLQSEATRAIWEKYGFVKQAIP